MSFIIKLPKTKASCNKISFFFVNFGNTYYFILQKREILWHQASLLLHYANAGLLTSAVGETLSQIFHYHIICSRLHTLMRSVGRREMACSDPNQPAADVKRHTVAESSNMMYISHSLLSTKMQRHPLCAFCWARAKELHFQTGDLLLERKQCYIYIYKKWASVPARK